MIFEIELSFVSTKLFYNYRLMIIFEKNTEGYHIDKTPFKLKHY